METSNTLPKLLKRNCEEYGDRQVAMRVKDRGIWKKHTYKVYYEKVKYFSLGLIGLGLNRGDRVSILGENKPEWYWAELAAQAAGGVVVGIFSDCIPSEVKYYVEHSYSRFVVAHDQEQVDKLLQIKDELPFLSKVIYWDPKGLWFYDESILMSFDEVLSLGNAYESSHADLFEENIEKRKGEDLAVFLYTSGTSGLPKAAMVSHEALVAHGRRNLEYYKWQNNDQYLSFMPGAWITEQTIGIAGSLVSPMQLNFPEEPETVQENIREIGAAILFFGPRQWESVIHLIQAKIIDTTQLLRCWIPPPQPQPAGRHSVHGLRHVVRGFSLAGRAFQALNLDY